MRPSKNNRNGRNKGGRKPMGNIVNRVFDSAGPEGKVRGAPQQIIDKYLALARDAQTAGDRVMTENFLQHAEHYIRMLSAAQEQMEEQRRQQQARQPDEQPREELHQADEAEGDEPQQPRRNRGRRRAEAPESESSGLETIDVDQQEETSSMLVGEDAAEQPAPRRRRRAPKPEAEGDAPQQAAE